MRRRQGFLFGRRVSAMLAMIVFAVFTVPLSAQIGNGTDVFAGRVVFQGKPVAGANVYLRGASSSSYNRNLPVDFYTKTDKDGNFSFARPVIDGMRITYGIIATYPGCSIGGAIIMTQNDPENIIVTLYPPAAVSGVVRYIAGEPLENVEIVMVLYRHNGPESIGNIRVVFDLPELIVKTDRNGRFTFRNIPSNSEVAFVASRPGYITQSLSTTSGTDDNDIVMEPGGTISGKVTNRKTGDSVDGIRVRVQATNSSGSDETRTGKDGRYTLTGLEPGLYQVAAVPDSLHIGLCSRPVESVLVERAGETKDVDIALQEGMVIEGLVTEQGTDKPVEGCSIRVEMPVLENNPGKLLLGGITYLNGESFVTSSITTDKEGRFKATVLPGLVTITLSIYEGYDATINQNTQRQFAVSSTGNVPQVHFELIPEKAIPGIVYLPDGKPAAGVDIGMPMGVISNRRGEFALRNLRPGRMVTLNAEHRELRLEGSATFEPSSADTVRIYLHPYRYAFVSGIIIDYTGAPVKDESIELWNADGLWVLENARAALSGIDGSFTVDSLRVGKNYFLGAQGQQAKSPQFIASAINQHIQLVLPKADRWIAGRVVDVKGAPVYSVNITISSELSGFREVTTDENGRFRIEHLVGETENLLVGKQSYYPVYFKNIPTNTERDFLFPPQNRRLGGRVIDESGRPVAGARVVVAQAQYTLNSADTETTTDSFGRFAVQRLFGETVTVTVIAEGYKTLQTEQKTNDENVTFVLRK